MVLGMETKIFVWIVMGWCEFLDFYMKFLLELGFITKNNQITDQITDLKNWSVITDQITTI